LNCQRWYEQIVNQVYPEKEKTFYHEITKGLNYETHQIFFVFLQFRGFVIFSISRFKILRKKI